MTEDNVTVSSSGCSAPDTVYRQNPCMFEKSLYSKLSNAESSLHSSVISNTLLFAAAIFWKSLNPPLWKNWQYSQNEFHFHPHPNHTTHTLCPFLGLNESVEFPKPKEGCQIWTENRSNFNYTKKKTCQLVIKTTHLTLCRSYSATKTNWDI